MGEIVERLEEPITLGRVWPVKWKLRLRCESKHHKLAKTLRYAERRAGEGFQHHKNQLDGYLRGSPGEARKTRNRSSKTIKSSRRAQKISIRGRSANLFRELVKGETRSG
jgi:hypothetical protein